MGAVHHTIATSVYHSLNYDFQKDFAPVTMVALVPNILVVNPKVPAHNVQELLALARKTPGKLTFGSNGMGTAQHLIGAQFQDLGRSEEHTSELQSLMRITSAVFCLNKTK